ncbi:MAG: M14 family metallocarboxypeptidase [Clostridia bacterium]|nr:M14 family metallocarboxypeptidase [Clostridia bacterium]
MDYKELLARTEKLEEENPLLSFGYLGTSLLGRGIPMLTLGRGRLEVLYVGTHHALEWLTSDLLLRFLEEAKDPGTRRVSGVSIAELFECVKFYVVPMLNPDGVEYVFHGISDDNPIKERVLAMNGGSKTFSSWQANGRGVDLNHNYNDCFSEYQAASGIQSGAPTRFAGEEPESEPEVAYLCGFLRHHPKIRGVLSFHTQGEVIYYQSRGVMLPSSLRIAKRMEAVSGYRLERAEGLSSYGGLTDWCLRTMKIPAFTIECGRGENPLPKSELKKIYSDLRTLLYLFPTWL